jgi:hypothetical protein
MTKKQKRHMCVTSEQECDTQLRCGIHYSISVLFLDVTIDCLFFTVMTFVLSFESDPHLLRLCFCNMLCLLYLLNFKDVQTSA